jgi:hypothetical protein
MPLTTQQAATLKAAIDANPTWSAFPLTGDGYIDLAAALSRQASPNFWVYATDVDVQTIKDAVIWSSLTPTDAPDGTQAWTNRSLQCQGKQFNLQLILPVTGPFNASNINARAGLQDALQGVRSGAGGVVQDAGWSAVRQSLTRRASHFERMFADTANGNGSTRSLAATMVLEGAPSHADIEQARNA